MVESAREKRVLDRAEIELEQALKDCRWLTEEPENQRSLLLPKPFETRYLGGKKSKYSYRPRFSSAASTSIARTLSASFSSISDF